MRLTEARLLSLDLETTHADPNEAEILEVGGLYLRGLAPDGRAFASRMNPGCPIPPEASAVNKIYDADVAHLPPFSDFAERIVRRLDGVDAIVGYNFIRYDLVVLRRQLGRVGLAVPANLEIVIDPLLWIRFTYRDWPRRKMTDVCERWDIPIVNAHSAAADVTATGAILARLVADGVIPDDLDACLARQAEILAFLAEEESKYGHYLYRDRDASRTLRIGYGKHAGTRLVDVPVDYLKFCLEKFEDLPPTVIQAFQIVIDQSRPFP